MSNIEAILAAEAPRTLAAALANWPQRDTYHPSPADWRDQVFYFLLPDRFSDGRETSANLLKGDVKAARGSAWSWKDWCDSGANRFQGGTLQGIASKLDYLHALGATTLWIAPVFRQRAEENTYHGYGMQDFLDIDPRFGTRRDLVELVRKAHDKGMCVVLDVVFNHAGCDWLYEQPNGFQPPYLANGSYTTLLPRSGNGAALPAGTTEFQRDDYIWPQELQGADAFLRAGSGNLGAGDIADPNAEHKRTDFCSLRKFQLSNDRVMSSLLLAYHYWIALADIDGMRVDTFKHVTFEQGRTFANGIKEYAEVLKKDGFFVVAEVAGGNATQSRYLQLTGRNLDACLDIGEQRETLCQVAKGLCDPSAFFGAFDFDDAMGSHRNWGSQHLSISNDHDHVFGPKVRFSADASNDHQAIVPIAMQLFTLGIPCIYYGTEQALASGVESEERKWLPFPWASHDCLLREAMFGPAHPLASGRDGRSKRDDALPGFGPHGTAGKHVFDGEHPVYRRIAQLTAIRSQYRPLRRGRQYRRQTSFDGRSFALHDGGQLLAWSRLFDDQELLIVVNTHGVEARAANIVIDATLSKAGMTVVACTDPAAARGSLKPGNQLAAQRDPHGRTFLTLPAIGASEVVVLANHSALNAKQ